MPEEFTKLVAIDIATYSEIAKAAGIKVAPGKVWKA